MELITIQNVVFIPALIVITLYLLNIYYFFQKRNEGVIIEDKIPVNKIASYFVLFAMLLTAPIVYNFIVFQQITANTVAITQQDMYIYGGLWLLGVFLQAVVVNRFFAYIVTKTDIKKVVKSLPFVILGIMITESFNIFALVYIFQKLGG